MVFRKLFKSIFTLLIIPGLLFGNVRIKDIASVEGIRENYLIGYGLVVGLNGTGDKDQTKFTQTTLADYLKRLGQTDLPDNFKVKNVAAVIVTAKLPPFARAGQSLTVTVSSTGDASSLEGGTLIVTPLAGPNGRVYAVAQGALIVGGGSASSGGSSVTKNHPTVGMIPGGAKVEQEVNFEMEESEFNLFFDQFSLSDVVSAKNLINNFAAEEIAMITSPSNINVRIPEHLVGRYYEFLDSILNLKIQPDTFARVVIQERTGTIVFGSDVRISTVAVAHGSLTVTIASNPSVSQPDPLSGGQTVVTNNPTINIAEDKAQLMIIPEGVTVSDLVKALNAIGASPRDLISILENIDKAGALQGRLEVI